MTGSEQRSVWLHKGGERFEFRYFAGQEARVLSELVTLAENPASRLDWYDAAILSFEMGREQGNRSEMCLR